MKIIVGLGNPAVPEYEKTRHNLGRRMVETLSDSNWEAKQKLFADVADVKIDGKKILLARPTTYMNESGKAVSALARFHKIKPDDLLVIHDDSDIFFGKIKLSYGSRSAGHRGVESVIRAIKTKNFWRLRIGIRPPNEEIRRKADELILEEFTQPEETKLQKEVFPRAIEIIKAWVNK